MKGLAKGDVVDVTWVDITEEPHGHPDKMTPSVMTHTWRYQCHKTYTIHGHKVPCVVFTSSKAIKDEDYYHAIVIPKGAVLGIKPATRRHDA